MQVHIPQFAEDVEKKYSRAISALRGRRRQFNNDLAMLSPFSWRLRREALKEVKAMDDKIERIQIIWSVVRQLSPNTVVFLDAPAMYYMNVIFADQIVAETITADKIGVP